MDAERRESLLRSLRSLAESQAATLRLMEETYALLSDELALDPLDGYTPPGERADGPAGGRRPVLDDTRLTVTYLGRTCYLGPTLPYRILVRLARRPNCYVNSAGGFWLRVSRLHPGSHQLTNPFVGIGSP